MVTSAELLVMSLSSRMTVPVVFPNWPRTLDTMRCLTTKELSVWLGSISQVEAAAGRATRAARATSVRIRCLQERGIVSPLNCGLLDALPVPGIQRFGRGTDRPTG